MAFFCFQKQKWLFDIKNNEIDIERAIKKKILGINDLKYINTIRKFYYSIINIGFFRISFGAKSGFLGLATNKHYLRIRARFLVIIEKKAIWLFSFTLAFFGKKLAIFRFKDNIGFFPQY